VRYDPTTRDYANVLLARCDRAAQKGRYKKRPPTGPGNTPLSRSERTSALSGALDRLVPAGGGVECVAGTSRGSEAGCASSERQRAVGAGRTDGRYRPVGPRNGYASQEIMRSVYGNSAPFHGPWVFDGILFIQVRARVRFPGGPGTEGVMQGKQGAVSIQSFICPLPEAPRLPKTAGLSVAYGRDRNTHNLG
jgi:hypothetical protein